jgi:PAS domain S-box-containing protein
LAGLAAAGAALSAAAVAVALSGAGPEPRWPSAIVHALVIAAPIGAGLYALYAQPASAGRFGRLLVLSGFLWSPTLLAESADSLLYSVGRVSAWLAEVLLVYVVLSYPSGRLTASADKLLFRAAALTVGVLFLPSVLLVEQYPLPNPWSSCGSDCPPNAFLALGSEPGFVDALVIPLEKAASALVYAAVAVALALRLVRGSRLTRVGLLPVVAVATLRMAVAAAFIVARARRPDSQLTEVLGTAALLCMPAFSVAFVIGLLRARMAAARALVRLGARYGSRPEGGEVRDLIADAVEDPSLEVLYWNSEAGGGWTNTEGEPVSLPSFGPDRAVTEVRGSRGRVAVLVHDPALADAPVITDVARGFALMALENQRLETQLRSSLRELRESRERIMSAADLERRRIERDLHDGAQQRLVSLRIQLELAGDLVEAHPERAGRRLRELSRDVDDAVDEVRSLARGLVPPILVERGLVEALRDAAHGGHLRVTVHERGLGRYPPEIESAVYFACLEALQNAAKHAEGARSASLSLWEDEELRFEVRDDGAGLPEGHTESGAGLTNMRDRIGAVGGRLAIGSVPGQGTCVAGSVPVGPAVLPPQVETLLQRATEALEESFGIYRAVRDERGAVVDFLIEHVNEAARNDFGLPREQLVGQTLCQLFPAYRDSAAFLWQRRVLEQGRADSRVETTHLDDAGSSRQLRRAVDVSAAPLGGGRLVLTWHDVTRHTQLEEQVRLQSLVLDRAAEGVCLVRASDATIVHANPRFTEILGYTPGELDGRPVAEINWEDEPGEADQLVAGIAADLAAGGEGSFQVRNRRKDGSAIWCESHVVVFEHPDHGTVWVGVHQELTPRREESAGRTHGRFSRPRLRRSDRSAAAPD